jgi:hypothetical protein
MIGKIARKILVILIIIIPVFTNADCKKQPKCGCDGDILFTLTNSQAHVYYNETGTSITFQLLSNPYDTYNFCNPSQMFPNLSDTKNGDIVLISGHAYWECNYLYQSSNSSYSQYYKIYMMQVTEVKSNLYGK